MNKTNGISGGRKKIPLMMAAEAPEDIEAQLVISKRARNGFVIEGVNEEFERSFARRNFNGESLDAVVPRQVSSAISSQLRKNAGATTDIRFELTVGRGQRAAIWNVVLTPLSRGRRDHSLMIVRIRKAAPSERGHSAQEIAVHLLERFAATVHDVMYIADVAEQKIVYVNERIEGVLGYPPKAVTKFSPSFLIGLVHPADQAIVVEHLAALARLADGETRSVEYRMRRADGQYAWLRSSDAVFQRASDGSVRKIVGSAIDVTDCRHLLENLRQTSSRLLESQNQERRRIARELHDSTAQHLVAMGISLARLDRLIHPNLASLDSAADIANTMQELRSVAREAQNEIRTFSYLLHPPILESLGLAETLRRFVAGFARRTRIDAKLTVARDFSCGSHAISTALMRVAQEALLNVFRHASASEVRLSLVNQEQRIRLEVRDNGRGFAAPSEIQEGSPLLGVGLLGMRARVEQFRGELVVLSDPAGTLVRATIPERNASLVQPAKEKAMGAAKAA
ncbi:MAG: PAS domain-containing protein [Bradyrhizobiaceae bacterium]|nr:PAS domain-containing protein [Bradyrhizobiaceae bacterium]